IGFQAGVQSSDVVLVFRNDRSLDNLVNGKFTLGADAGVAAGP
ncbi:YSC84-related protein, partial [Stenotrophomonas maltophilia]